MTLLCHVGFDFGRKLRVEEGDRVDGFGFARRADEGAFFEEFQGELTAEESSSACDNNFHS